MKILNDKKIYSVSEVNYFAKETLEQLIVWVEGEVSILRKNPSWNFYYLDLKDEKATLSCIVNGDLVESIGQDITNKSVIAFGNLSLYEPQGKYQLKISHIELSGSGELYKKLEELIKKLKNEGLFEARHKKELPAYPKRVCIVTSQESDAWHDFKTHSVDKFPIIDLTTADVRVQGKNAVSDLLNTLPQVDKQNFDVIVITRGGGSIEDLSAYNSEEVARAIFNMKTPTVVAVGHEANESLAEWVADRRASTPTDAANIVTASYQNILEKLQNINYRLKSKVHFYENYFQKLDFFYSKLMQSKISFQEYPHRLLGISQMLKSQQKNLITDAQVKLNGIKDNFEKLSKNFLNARVQELNLISKSLEILSPTNTLKRGYSITTDKNGMVIRSIKSVVIGQLVAVKLADGSITSQVKSKHDQK